MNQLREIVASMQWHDLTPIDQIMRNSKTPESVPIYIDHLLERAERLNKQFGMPGYCLKTLRDFQTLKNVAAWRSDDDFKEKLSKRYHLLKNYVERIMCETLVHGVAEIDTEYFLKTDLRRKQITVERKTQEKIA